MSKGIKEVNSVQSKVTPEQHSAKQELEAKIAVYKKQIEAEKVAGSAEQIAGTQAEIDGLKEMLARL